MVLHGDTQAMVTFVGYISIVMLVGLAAFLLTKSLSDYVLGGRSLGGPVAALSAGASDMSSWLLLALPGVVYATGLKGLWIVLSLVGGAYLSWRFIATRLRIYSAVARGADSLTIPAFLDNRFHDDSRAIRVVSAIAILCFFTFYMASGLVASGLLLSEMFGLEYIHALWLGTSIIMLYTLIGGFLAVSWTDFFQGTLMLICLLLVPLVANHNLGGWEATTLRLSEININFFQKDNLGLLGFLSLFGWGLGYFGMPHILVRFMAVKSTKAIPVARRICMWWMTLSMIGAILTGLVGASYFCDCPIENQEMIFVLLSGAVFSPWMLGIITAAILSSSMCAIDSQMLAASSALTEDIYRRLFRPHASESELVWVGRIGVPIIAIAAIVLALTPSKSIMDLVSFAWAGLGATFGPTVILSLYWKRMTKNGAIVAMVLGGVTVVVWKLTGLSSELYEMVPAFSLSFIGAVLVSLKDKAPSEQVLADFEAYQAFVAKDEAPATPGHYREAPVSIDSNQMFVEPSDPDMGTLKA